MKKERNLAIAGTVQAIILTTEIVGGILTGSVALLADASHMFIDLLNILAARWASRAAKRPKTARQTFTAYKAKDFVASLGAAALMTGVFFLTGEAIAKLFSAAPIFAKGMIIIAAIGLGANVFNFFLLKSHHKDDISVRNVLLHVAGDGISSLIVLTGGVLIYFWNISIIDPLLTLGLNVWLFWQGFKILQATKPILLEELPKNMEIDPIIKALKSVEGIKGLHHLHIRPLGDQKYALSSHIVVEPDTTMKSLNIFEEASQRLKAFAVCETAFQPCSPGIRFNSCECKC